MIYIALGSNLESPAGPPRATLAAALARLAGEGVRPAAVSPFYLTPAWPDPADPPFVNAAARLETALAPHELLGVLQSVERAFGRRPGPRNTPRPLDLDLLDYGGRVEAGPPALPHPRLAARGFVLFPLRDVAPEWRHPATGARIGALIAALPPESCRIEPLP